MAAITKILLLPVIVLLDAFGFLHLEVERRAHLFGWLDDRMDEHWDRLANPQHPAYKSFYHSAKNVMTEWVRLDPQRAGKAFSFWLVASILCNALLIVGLAL